MKREWFEPGPDGESPFEREYYNHRESGTIAGNAIAAAFRALLAGEDEQATPVVHVDLASQPDVARAVHLDERGNVLQEVTVTHDGGQVFSVQPAPVEFAIGDVVRLEPWDYSYSPEVLRATWTGEQARIIEAPEGHDWNRDGHIHVELLVHKGCSHATWPVSALTLIRRAGEATPADAKDAEIARLTAEVERWKFCVDAHEQNYRAMLRRVDEVAAERDALRARIDAGVPVCRFPIMKKSWSENLSSFPESCERGILLIDARPIEQPVDERTGPADRRQSEENLQGRHRRVFQERGFKQQGATYRERQQCNDRRRTAGTIADRGKA